MKTLRLLLVHIGLLLSVYSGLAQQMPQDNWVYEGKHALGVFRCLHIAKDNRIYVGSTNKIAVIDTELNFLSEFGPVGTVLGIASDSQTNIYVLEASTVKVFNPTTGALVNQWGSAGSADGQFTVPSTVGSSGTAGQPQINGLAIDENDHVYIANSGGRVLVLSSSGAFIRTWGPTVAGVGHSLGNSLSIGITSSGNVALMYAHPTNPNFTVFQIFTPEGVFITSTALSASNNYNGGRQITTTPDGRLVFAFAPGPDRTSLSFEHSSLAPSFIVDLLNSAFLQKDMGHTGSGNTMLRIDGISYSSDGAVFVNLTSCNSSQFGTPRGLSKMSRVYSTNAPPLSNPVPQPRLASAKQRPTTTFVDLDYFIHDTDSPNVSVRFLGFTNGVNTLTGLIKLNTFVEGTAANLGPNVPANSTNRVTWDAATDWNVGFGNIQFEVLAKDERGMLPFHFITIPAGAGGVDPLVVSDKPVTDADLLSVWFWLVASNDPEIEFVNGVVRGVNAPYAGVTLASGTTTTSQGRTYIYSRLGVRAISTTPTNEVTRANAGRYGFPATVTSSHVVKLP